MTGWRRFELLGSGKAEYREIRQQGIRCFPRWGSIGANSNPSTSTLNDEEHARRHASRKINQWLRNGFTEVDRPCDEAELDLETPVLDVIKASTRPHALVPEYLAVDGFDEVYCRAQAPEHPMGFYEYFVLREQGRGAVRFTVRGKCNDTDAVTAFLDFLSTRRDLAFDGQSHHKVPLPEPVGPFSHALFCAPALGQGCRAYPAIADRVATALPVFDCEIGDADPEVLVAACTAARIGGPPASGADIDHEAWTWEVCRQTTTAPGELVDEGTRGKRRRTVPIIPEIRPMVAARLDAVGHDPMARLFTGPHGGRITTAILRDATH